MNRERWAALKTLFERALELGDAEREGFLDDLASRDPGLHGELRALLAADALDRQAVDADPGLLLGSVERDDDPGPDPRVGSRIGPWRVEARLGEGGMGVVYRAERADGAFDQRVALKVLRRGMDTEAILARFRSERQILAGLDHPNIARLVDGGATDDGLPWFTLEYVRGTHLTDYCDQRRLGVDARLALFETVCAAVQYAQERLVVHRDLKPSNVLVSDDGAVKLLDFGIARVLSDGGSDRTTVVDGPRALTLAYAAPEQIEGGTITTATDVYALGTMLYELLTGFRPRDFSGGGGPKKPSDLPTRTQQTLSAARGVEPGRLRHRLAGDLDTICLKALQDDPARRYATAGELLDDLRRHREGRPVRARPDTFTYRASRFVGRNRTAVAGIAAAAILVLATAATYTVRLAAERDRARLAAAEAQEVTAFLEGLFEVSDPSESLGRSLTAAEVLETGRRRLDVELREQPRIRAALLATVGRVYRNLGLWSEARPLLDEALEIRTAQLGPDHADIAESLRDLSVLNRLTDRFAEADSLQRLALEMGVRLEGEGSEQNARDLAALGAVAFEAGQWNTADSLLRVALDLQRATHAGDHEDIAATLHTLGAVGYLERDFAAAEALFREAYEMRTRLHPPGHPEVIRTYDDWGNGLASSGRAEEAEAVAREVIDMWEALHGPNHPDVALAYHSLGATLQFQGRYDEAVPQFLEALRRFEASVGLEHSGAASIFGSLARCYRLLGRLDEADDAAVRRVELDERIYGSDSEARLIGLSMLGNLRADQERYDEALAVYEQIDRLVEFHAEYDRVNYENRAATYRDMGDTTAMMEMYRASVDAARRFFPDDPLEHVGPMITLGQNQARMGDWTGAAETLGRVYEIRRARLPGDSWFVWNALSLYGWATMGTPDWREAGPLLAEAYEGLVASDRSTQADVIDLRTRATVERLVDFHLRTGDDAERSRWEAVLESMPDGSG